MAKEAPNEWRGAALPLGETFITEADAATIGKAGNIPLTETMEAKFSSKDGERLETRTVTKLAFLQHRLNRLAQNYVYNDTCQNGPTHTQTVEALGQIRKLANKLRKRIGLPKDVEIDDVLEKLPAAIYDELTLPARKIAAATRPSVQEPIYDADTVLQRAVAGFLTLEHLIEEAHEGAQQISFVTNTDGGADVALDVLLRSLGEVYEIVSGRRPAHTVSRAGEGGPFVRFAIEACKSIGVSHVTVDGVATRFKRLPS